MSEQSMLIFNILDLFHNFTIQKYEVLMKNKKNGLLTQPPLLQILSTDTIGRLPDYRKRPDNAA